MRVVVALGGNALALAAGLRWTIAADGPRWRRVVASPRPLGLVEIETVRALADSGALVVCGGGGGVPVVRSGAGELTGVRDRRADRCRRHPGRPGRYHHQRHAALVTGPTPAAYRLT